MSEKRESTRMLKPVAIVIAAALVLMGVSYYQQDEVTFQLARANNIIRRYRCSAGTYGVGRLPNGNCACARCPYGSRCVGGYSPPRPCNAGTYQNIRGQNVCKRCRPGTYQRRRGQRGCIRCPRGTVSGWGSSRCIRRGPRCSYVNLRRHRTGQISTGWRGVSSRAVDGNANRHYGRNSCTHTSLVNRPWWFVDLGRNAGRSVCSVRLHNRGDCCQSRLTRFRIFVTNRRPIPGRAFAIRRGEICYDYRSTRPFSVRTFACRRRLRGRYVGVQLMKRDYLTLCEVQVALGPQVRRPCYANGALKMAEDENGNPIPMKDDVVATQEEIESMQVAKPDVETEKLMAVPDRFVSRWIRVPGALTNVAISSLGSLYGVNRYRHIWAKRRYNVGPWRRLPGSLTQISVNNAGTVVTGVNRHRHIWYTRVNVRNLGAVSWRRAPGSLVDVSSGNRFMYGVNHFDHIWRANLMNRNWCRLPGALRQISAHGGKVVGVNRHGHVWQYLGYGRWRRFRFAPRARWASMGRDGDMWVIATNQLIYRMARNRRFGRIPGALVQIDVADRNNVVGVNRHQQIWQWVRIRVRYPCIADPQEGALMKGPNRPHVYQIFGGKRHWIPNPRTYNNLYKRSARIVTSSCMSTVPPGQSYSNGARLIKCRGYNHIYLYTNGQKRWICNPSSYRQYNFGNKVTTLSLAQCRRICNGPIICNSISAALAGRLSRKGRVCRGKPADGTLFKCASAHVYQQIDGEKQHIPNPAAFVRIYGRQAWKKILTYPRGFCRQVESGVSLSSNAKLIRCGSYPHVFLLSNGVKRWVCNLRALYMYHYRFGRPQRLSIHQCKKFCLGQPLCLSVAEERRQPAHDQVHSLEPHSGCEE